MSSVGDKSNPDGTRSVNQRSLSLWRKNSVHSVNSVRNKKISVSDKHSEGVKNPCHLTSNVFGKAKNERIKKKRKKKSEQSVSSVGDNNIRKKFRAFRAFYRQRLKDLRFRERQKKNLRERQTLRTSAASPTVDRRP